MSAVLVLSAQDFGTEDVINLCLDMPACAVEREPHGGDIENSKFRQ